MERFVLTTKVAKRGFKSDLVLEMQRPSKVEGYHGLVLHSFKIPINAGKPLSTKAAEAAYYKTTTALRVAELRGLLFNAEKVNSNFPATFDGSAREFSNILFEKNYRIGELVIDDYEEGMRLAMAFMIAGKCNTISKMNKVIEGIVNLEKEVVLYFFTLMAYGNRQKAGRAALYALLTTKN
jgi:hypothetical protein